MEIRLQKRIADSGLCSRRKAEELIEAGKVSVNGIIITRLGTKVSPEDKIEVNGKAITTQQKNITIALNKPAGLITSKSDPHHSKTIMDLLPAKYKNLKPIGRLDKDSEGLLLLSSDGELIQRLTHPSHKHTKTYEILVRGIATEKELNPLKSGKLKLEGYTLNKMDYKILKTSKNKGTWIRLKLTEGRKRQIRRVMDSLGYPVIYLKRTAIGQFVLEGIEKGAFKELSEDHIHAALS